MLAVIVYTVLNIIMDFCYLRANFITKTFFSFIYQFMISCLSLVCSTFLIATFLDFFVKYGLFKNYLKLLTSITKGELSEVGGNVFLQLTFGICFLSLLLYSMVIWFGKRQLSKALIINNNHKSKIEKLSVNGILNKLYTTGIFWCGFVPLFAEIFGNQEFVMDISGFAIFTFVLAIPFTHINLFEDFSLKRDIQLK